MTDISTPREELLASLHITTDEVLGLFSRDVLLSALGFDAPSDYLYEVTLRDAIEHYDHSDIADAIDINGYWDIDDAYLRYGSDLLEYFEDYQNTYDWSASDHIENYGDSIYLLDVLLAEYMDVEDLYGVLSKKYKEELGELLKPKTKVKHEILSALLKANYEVLRENRCIIQR